MIKTLIVAATHQEVAPLYNHFKWPKADFIETRRIDALITGVGMTATAFGLGLNLPGRYNLILNLGIAGAFDRSIALGDVVNVTEDTFAELGAEDKDNFITLDELGFGQNTYQYHNFHNFPEMEKMRGVRSITVNAVHGNTNSITAVVNRLNPQIESMEGAAVFYAGSMLNIPSIQVRAVSNYVEERNKESWKIGLAIKNLNEWAIDFLTTT